MNVCLIANLLAVGVCVNQTLVELDFGIEMENRILIAGLILLGSFSSAASSNTSSCIAPNVQEGNKYRISYSGRTKRVKILKINAGSCWVKVKAVSSASNAPVMGGISNEKPYWVNFGNVSSVR